MSNKKIFKLLLQKICSLLLKKGKSTKIEHLLQKTLIYISERNFSPYKVLTLGLEILRPYVKTRNTRVRGTFYIVPLPQTQQQRFVYAIRFLLEEIKINKRNLSKTLAEEFLKLYNDKSSVPELKIDKLNLIALKNKTFSFYRWF